MSLIYLAPFRVTFVLRCFKEAETQSRNPPGQQSSKDKLPLNRKKPGAGPGLQGGANLLRVSWVKEEKKREKRERNKDANTARISQRSQALTLDACMFLAATRNGSFMGK